MFPIEGEADGLAAPEEKIVQFHKEKADFENPDRRSGGKWARRVSPISGQTEASHAAAFDANAFRRDRVDAQMGEQHVW
jgi:hypothetical protein